MAFNIPAFTTIDKAIVTACGFIITAGGLIAQYGGLVHLPANWLAFAAAVVGIATTIGTYLAKGPEQARVEKAARAAKRATPYRAPKPRKTAKAAQPPKDDPGKPVE